MHSEGELDETSVGISDKSSGGRKPKIYNCYYTYDCRIKSGRKRYHDNIGHEFIEDVGKSAVCKVLMLEKELDNFQFEELNN
ncbi:hypothetical protein NXH64_03915 [Butyrivibrio fibrisolvens]|uniref:hypothetical protein n=1 Tax=Pseudobutyrivibrio ruminis TaxID=46206 RepID=UPI0018C9BCCE|nr:hypothetical protein [Pseudobutyrivibrio ruminis]MDC7278645.1 hypothetical protein [Butyrivibrio fibrisolvens]